MRLNAPSRVRGHWGASSHRRNTNDKLEAVDLENVRDITATGFIVSTSEPFFVPMLKTRERTLDASLTRADTGMSRIGPKRAGSIPAMLS